MHDVSFYCDDIRGTVAELRKRGARFTHGIEDHGYGFVTYFDIPGGIHVQLYEPKYAKHRAKPAARKPKRTKKAAKKRAPTRGVARGAKAAKGRRASKAKKKGSRR
jgi:hypothetical protein